MVPAIPARRRNEAGALHAAAYMVPFFEALQLWHALRIKNYLVWRFLLRSAHYLHFTLLPLWCFLKALE